MSRKFSFVAICILSALFATTFYGQQQDPAAETPPSLPGVNPPGVEGDNQSDPLLKEMTELFLNDKGTNRKLEYPKDAQANTEGKSSSFYHAAELLLKAARILEAKAAKGDDNTNNAKRVAQLRAIAVEMLTQ